MSIGNRLIELRNKSEDSRRTFSERINIAENTLRNYEQGLSLPNSDVIANICREFKVSVNWLIFGEGEMCEAKSTEENLSSAVIKKITKLKDRENIECENCELTLIPLVEAVLSAGGGSFETGGTIDKKYAFRTDFLKRKGQISQMVLMRVAGDSMEPEIKDKDVVLIDQSQKNPRANQIYAVAFNDMIYLKKINATPKSLILTSINKDYAPITIDMTVDQPEHLDIIGRAIWWCREA